MRWRIVLLVALVIGAIGGSWLKNLPGFVIIAYEKTSYEMRLWVAVALLLILLTILLLIGIFIRSLISSANRVKGWQGGRHWRKARKQTIKGMLAFVEGRWIQSEKTMISAAKKSDTKLINYLIAAQAAQQQNAQDRRDSYLRLAHKAEPEAKVAIGLTQAQLQLDNNQFEQALATLNDLRVKHPNHPYILKLLCMSYQKLQDCLAIIELLPTLKKHNVFDAEELLKIGSDNVQCLLKSEAKKGELESLKDAWLNLPSASRKIKDNILFYATLLIEFEQMDEAEKWIKPLIKKEPGADVISLYGKIKSSSGNKQFSFLENWLNNSSQAPNSIYLALGKIAFELELWGKARFYLERSLRVEPSAECYFMMARTLQQLEDDDHAAECYRQGLEFVVHPTKPKQALLLAKGADDLVGANLLPKFEKV
jgi:HemY protein